MPDPNPKNERRFFLCTGHSVKYSELYKYAGSHILGELVYVRKNDRKVTALARYKRHVDADTVPPIKPDIIEWAVGDVLWIKCGVDGCPHSQSWEWSRSGILGFMENIGLKEEFLEMEKREAKVQYKELDIDVLPSCKDESHIWRRLGDNILDEKLPEDDQLCVCGKVTWKESMYNKT